MFTVVLIFDTPGLIDKMIKPFSLFYSFSSGNIFDVWNELLIYLNILGNSHP